MSAPATVTARPTGIRASGTAGDRSSSNTEQHRDERPVMVEPSCPRYWFDRRTRQGRPGESVLDGLVRDGLPTLQRSPRYHRPRAPFCGIGQCTGCLVRVNGRPNVRACRYVPADGDRVTTENGWPSQRFDLLAILDGMFRHGIDTLHGFRRPAFATPLYHRVIRRLAGYGQPPTAESAAGLGGPAGRPGVQRGHCRRRSERSGGGRRARRRGRASDRARSEGRRTAHSPAPSSSPPPPPPSYRLGRSLRERRSRSSDTRNRRGAS